MKLIEWKEINALGYISKPGKQLGYNGRSIKEFTKYEMLIDILEKEN